MSASEDEQQSLDAGWDDEPSLPGPTSDDEEDVDQAWDSLPPPVSAVSAPASSMPPVTEAVDSGWDDVPEGAPGPAGKRRPHRQRRPKSSATPIATSAASPVLLPRPAEPTKKQQREHARKQRAYEAHVKQQRKLERKQERASEMRREAEARKRQAEAEALERRQRREERERAERDRPKPVKQVRPKPSRAPVAKREPVTTSRSEVSLEAASGSAAPLKAAPGKLRLGVLLTLAALAAVVFLLLWRK